MIPLLKTFSRKNIKTFYAMYVPGMIPLLKAFSRKNIKTVYAMYVPGMTPLLQSFLSQIFNVKYVPGLSLYSCLSLICVPCNRAFH